MPKILVTEPKYFPTEKLSELRKLGDVTLKRQTQKELLADVKNYEIMVIRVDTKMDANVLKNAARLKLIVSMTTGLDHVDTAEARRRGVEVVAVPGYATTATAEFTISTILSLVRKIPWAFEHTKKEKWERHRFLGTQLSGKTLGVIGFGRIGSRVGRMAESMGMRVVFYDPYVDKSLLSGMKAAQSKTVQDLLEKSDIVTIHTFLSKETEGMINKNSISKMKRGSVLVNVSRGQVVKESDLIDALESGHISGAALDVFENEPLHGSERLLRYSRSHDNLLITPHIAGSTKESLTEAADLAIETIRQKRKAK